MPPISFALLLPSCKLRLEAIQEEGGFAALQAEKVEAEVDRLNELVDDLLQLARAASAESPGQEVDLAAAARSAVERWKSQAEAAGQVVRLEVDGACSAWADPGDIDHVLDNLIENAIHYSPDGSEVAVAVATEHATVIVSDNGPGIPLAERDRIFERFYRGATGRAAGSGSGLGLAIVAEITRRWGGSIRLHDGSGTRIEVVFARPPTNS